MTSLSAIACRAVVLPLALFFLVPVARAKPKLSEVFDTAKLEAIDAAITNALAQKKLPGAVFWLERQEAVYAKTYGLRAVDPAPEPMTEDTIFDVASLTKVIATTPSIMLLWEEGRLDLDQRVQRYIPEFRRNGKDEITVRQLLTHTSGLKAGLSEKPNGPLSAIQFACQEKTNGAPGTIFRYSDINYILLGEVVQRVAGMSLHEFAAQRIFAPLKMRQTGFLPNQKLARRIAPTEPVEGQYLRGVVHDPTARRMEGVAGHAGLFSTVEDLARFARMMLNEGELDGRRIFKPETVRLMTRVQTPDTIAARRGLGWDIDSGYSRPRGSVFPIGSFGHTGFTGTILWIDPFSKTFYVFLSNRVHPDGKGNILELYSVLGTLAAEAVKGFSFSNVPGALAPRPAATNAVASASAATNAIAVVAPAKPARSRTPNVRQGIDVLKRQDFAPLRGQKVGLITNHTGQDTERNATIDLLHKAPGVTLAALFSPEHGIRGEQDEKVADVTDAKTGLPVFSLYGERRSPASNQLAGLDALVFDIQDIGCRFYTYISTLGLCLEAAAQAKLKFFLLDRVNPITGASPEGPVFMGTPHFTAFHALPVRHGMTVGELALMFNAERGWKADLTVIPVEGWSREQWLDQTGLPWTNPSPNMRNLRAATLYPGVGLLEFAVSVGRGTDTPFELVGAPYIDDVTFAMEMNDAKLPGVTFVPVQFTPKASIFKDQPCGGVAITVTDRARCPVVDVGLTLALVLQRLYPGQFALDKVQTLLQDKGLLERIRADRPLWELKQEWTPALREFLQSRQGFLLYGPKEL